MHKLWYALLIGCGFYLSVTSATANTTPRLAIIIDDIGYNQRQSERAARLNGDFTLSILPFTPHGRAMAELAHQHGKEVMLHLPMSSINNIPLGKGGLISGMQKAAFLNAFQQDLASIPYIRGVNNHMGSRLTQETEPMEWLMEAMDSSGLYFVDSRTSAQTKAFDIARLYKIPSLKRDVFLDDINEQNAIEQQLKRVFQFAHQRGSALAIGHPYPNTLSVLERLQPMLDKQNIKLVSVSQLLNVLPAAPITSKELPIVSTDKWSYCPVEPNRIDFTRIVDLYDKNGMMNFRFFGY